MTMSANFHDIKAVVAQELGSASSLKFYNKSGGFVTVFMPYETALAMAEAYAAVLAPTITQAMEVAAE